MPRRPPAGATLGRAEPRERGADRGLLLAGERAPCFVADGEQRGVDLGADPALVGGRPSRSSARPGRDASRPSCLHGVHCPHDSTARKRATPAATASEVGVAVDDDEPGGAEAAAGGREVLVGERDVEVVGERATPPTRPASPRSDPVGVDVAER